MKAWIRRECDIAANGVGVAIGRLLAGLSLSSKIVDEIKVDCLHS